MGAEQLRELAKELKPFLYEEMRRDFMEDLRKEGYSVVKTDELHKVAITDLAFKRREMLQRDALKVCEILDAQLLPQAKSKTSLMRLINDKKTFKRGEAYQNSKKEWMILVSAIKRLAPHLR